MKVSRTRTTAYLVRQWQDYLNNSAPLYWTGSTWTDRHDQARPYSTRAVAEAVAAALQVRCRIVRYRVPPLTVIYDGD